MTVKLLPRRGRLLTTSGWSKAARSFSREDSPGSWAEAVRVPITRAVAARRKRFIEYSSLSCSIWLFCRDPFDRFTLVIAPAARTGQRFLDFFFDGSPRSSGRGWKARGSRPGKERVA